MIKAERRDSIRRLVEERGSASVKDIAAELAVSEMTVRRDLEEMSLAGDLVRVHRGSEGELESTIDARVGVHACGEAEPQRGGKALHRRAGCPPHQ